MHEEAMVRDLVRRVEEVVRDAGAERPSGVRLWLGALAHVTEAGLRDRWALAVRGTPLAGARLEVDVSTDIADARAESIVLESVQVATREAAHAR
jgi:hydrogenase nickel incorporation protein HypA/HybF